MSRPTNIYSQHVYSLSATLQQSHLLVLEVQDLTVCCCHFQVLEHSGSEGEKSIDCNLNTKLSQSVMKENKHCLGEFDVDHAERNGCYFFSFGKAEFGHK